MTLLRPCHYEMTESHDETTVVLHQGEAFSVNVSSGGMLILMAHAPQAEQVFEVHVPSLTNKTDNRLTLVESRWTREISVDTSARMFFVGVKFLVDPSRLGATRSANVGE